jgi:mono/diheme cytochrome c family protein
MSIRSLAISAICAAGALLAVPAHAAFDTPGYYQLRCAGCHGTQGQGTRAALPALGPALKGNPFIVNGSPAAIRNVIRKGRTGSKRLYNDAYPNMPSFGIEAVPDIDGLVAYLKGDLQK